MNRNITGCLSGFGIACLILLVPSAPAQDAAALKVEVVTSSIGMKLARIPAGTFQMGSPKTEVERKGDESAHEVTITKPFLIGVYEVTQTEFSRILGAEPAGKAVFKGPNRPMDNVTWEDAGAFCRALS